jgi:hypothetical protein
VVGPKAPLKPKHIWAIRQQLKSTKRIRDLAMFNCALDAKLRACDLVKLTVSDAAPGAGDQYPGDHHRHRYVVRPRIERYAPRVQNGSGSRSSVRRLTIGRASSLGSIL